MGPIWDFDSSSGNDYSAIQSPWVPYMQRFHWYKQWFSDPAFAADAATQWNTLKKHGVFSAWMASVRQEAAGLEQSQANNFARWPMLGIQVWPEGEVAGSYDGEVDYMMNWLQARFAYLDSVFNPRAATKTTLSPVVSPVRAGTPVTLTATVTGTSPTGVVGFQQGSVLIGVAPLSEGTASLTTNSLPVGAYNVRAFYNGDDNNALSVANVRPITVVSGLVTTVVSVSGPQLTGGNDAEARFTTAVISNSEDSVATGKVTFVLDHGMGEQATLSALGHASLEAKSLTNGSHILSVSYPGDAKHTASVRTISFKFPPPAVAPAFSRAAATLTKAENVSISDGTPDATIFYTIDGSTPTTTSTKYTGAIAVTKTETLKAIAVAEGYAQSALAEVTFKFK